MAENNKNIPPPPPDKDSKSTKDSRTKQTNPDPTTEELKAEIKRLKSVNEEAKIRLLAAEVSRIDLNRSPDLSVLHSEIPVLEPTPDALKEGLDIDKDDVQFSVVNEKIDRLRTARCQYKMLRVQIQQLEQQFNVHRGQTNTETITDLRTSLQHARTEITQLTADLTRILQVKEAQVPTLKIPPIARNAINKLEIKEVIAAVGIPRDRETTAASLEQVWNSLAAYAEHKGVSHRVFKQALDFVLGEEHHKYYINYQDLEIKDIAKKLANRFLSENKLSKATHEIDVFERLPGENLRNAVARLSANLDQVLILHPADQRETMRETLLKQKIREMATDPAKAVIDKYIANTTTQGLNTKSETLLFKAEAEERRLATTSTRKLNLFNTTTVPEQSTSSLSETAELKQQVQQQQEDIEQLWSCFVHATESDDDQQDMAEHMALAAIRKDKPMPRFSPYKRGSITTTSQVPKTSSILAPAKLLYKPQQTPTASQVPAPVTNPPRMPTDTVAAPMDTARPQTEVHTAYHRGRSYSKGGSSDYNRNRSSSYSRTSRFPSFERFKASAQDPASYYKYEKDRLASEYSALRSRRAQESPSPSRPFSRSNSFRKNNFREGPAPTGIPLVHAQHDSTVNISTPWKCQYCHSPFRHEPKACAVVLAHGLLDPEINE